MSLYDTFARPALFKLDPERAHGVALQSLRFGGALPGGQASIRGFFAPRRERPVELFGLRFPNPVGLAAGWDKDGLAWKGLAALGFGFVEVGTVTPRPQPGNPKPRVFRLEADQGVINRLGFPGRGADFVQRRLVGGDRPGGVVLGVNIGKNKDTPLENAADDYVLLIRRFAHLSDYLTVNVSSPNTPKLRELQSGAALHALLRTLDAERKQQEDALNRTVPLLVKLAPDLSDAELDDALDAILAQNIDGVIATNTTISREGLKSPQQRETGGLSGRPLTEMANEMVKKIVSRTDDKLPVIGVGGIMNAEDGQRRLDAGAKLIQVYTGMVYGGPAFVRELVQGLR
ncbi:MAG: quinone-dependent dihydroorotate dehydrogenase [Alphaproteobacteria bacterium]|nr:quinone-dependent dihydroorotate dehydrogenase [Alphaproteobacteria bacterium]